MEISNSISVVSRQASKVDVDTAGSGEIGWENNAGTWNTTGYSNNHLTAPGIVFSGATYASFHYDVIPIAKNQVIASATFSPYVVSAVGSAKACKINAQKVADAALPDNASNKPSSMTGAFTTAVTTLDNAALSLTGEQDWDVTAIVQEIVNQSGWASGNALNLIISNNGASGSEYPQIAMIGHGSNNGAPLTIVHTPR